MRNHARGLNYDIAKVNRDELARLKANINPIALLKELGMRNYTLSGGNLRTKCPIHGGKSQVNFVANIAKGRFTCYGENQCVVSGDIFDLVEAKFKNKGLAINFIKDFGRVWTPEEKQYIEIKIKQNSGPQQNKATEEVIKFYQSQNLSCWEKRGIDIPVINRFELGYAPASDRAIFPLRDENGTLYGCQGRLMDKVWEDCGIPRYITHPAGLIKSNHIYGLYQALEVKRWERDNLDNPPMRDTFVLFEGNFCTTALHQAALMTKGKKNWRPYFETCGSVMGSAISKAQAFLITKHFTKILVVPDWSTNNGTYAEKLVESAKHEFHGFCSVSRVNIPEFEFMGDIQLKDIGDYIEHRKSIDDVMWALDHPKFVS